MIKIARMISIIIIITAIMMTIIMIMMMIIIIIQSIYNEIKARSNKILKFEATAKSSALHPLERKVEKKTFSLFNGNYEDYNINSGNYDDFPDDSFIIDNNDVNYDNDNDNENNNDNNDKIIIIMIILIITAIIAINTLFQ